MPRTWGFLGAAVGPEGPPSPPLSSPRSDTYKNPRISRGAFSSSKPARRLSGFQEVKQQLIAFSQPGRVLTNGPPSDASADLTEQLRNLDFSGGNRAFGPASEPRFPFSGGEWQKPFRKGRAKAFGGPHGASAAQSREPSGPAKPLAFSGVSLSESQHRERPPPSPASIPGPSSGCDEGPPFCSPRALVEADISTTATLPTDAAVQQQQQQQGSISGQGSVALTAQQKQMHLQEQNALSMGVGFRAKEKTSASSPLSTRIGRCVDTLTCVCRLSLTISLGVVAGGSISMLFYSLLMDIMLQEQQRQAEAAAAAAACRQRHRDNGCETLNPIPPYLRGPCEEWKACLMAIPENHGETTKVAAQVVAQVLNAFFHSLHWRTIVAVTAFLWLMIYAYKALHYSLSVSPSSAPVRCTTCLHGGASVQAPAIAMQHEVQVYQQHQLLQQLEYEREVLRQQILRGSAPAFLLQSLGRQDAIQRELVYALNAESPHVQQQQRQAVPYLPHATKANTSDTRRPGFFRALLGSWLFKFLLVLWAVYACVVGCMYAARNNFIQFQLFGE